MAACPIPSYVDRCPPVRVYEVGGTMYVAFALCDKGNQQQVLGVFQLCDGVPSGLPSLYDLVTGAVYTPVGQVGICNEGDFEQNVFCDTSVDPPKPFISRVVFTDDLDIDADLTGTFELDGTTPYIPIGPVTVCGGDIVDTELVGPVCEKDAAGTTLGYAWHKLQYRGSVLTVATLSGYKLTAPQTWLNIYPIGAGNTISVCDPRLPQTILLCDIYPTPCEVGNQVSSANWTKTGSITGNGVDYFVFSEGGAPINAVITQNVAVTPGSTYTFSCTVSQQGLGGGAALARIEIFDGATVIHNQVYNGAGTVNVNLPGIVAPGSNLTIRISDQTTDGFDKDVTINHVSLVCVTPVDIIITKRFLRHYCLDCATGTFRDTELDGTTPYTPSSTGVIQECASTRLSSTSLCFTALFNEAAKGITAGDKLTRIDVVDIDQDPAQLKSTHWLNQNTGLMLSAAPNLIWLRPCDTEIVTFQTCYKAITAGTGWSIGDTLYRISVTDYPIVTSGIVSSIYFYNASVGTSFSPTAAGPLPGVDLVECSMISPDDEFIELCDDSGAFLRRIVRNEDGSYTVDDLALDGSTAYTPVGNVHPCVASGVALIKACDMTTINNPGVPGVCGVNQQVIDTVDIQDAEEKNAIPGGSSVNNNDNDLEMAGTAEPGETDYQIAIRFNVNIPQGATICSAHIQFTAEGNVSTDPFSVAIRGEAADDSAPFTTAAGTLTARTKTTAVVDWTDLPVWVNNASGAAQRTPDLSEIVQEIVNRAGWVGGNAAAFYFVPTTTTGYRRASSIRDGSEAPKLHVEYVLNGVATTTTTCVPFYKEIDLSTGTGTGNNYRINKTTGAWEAYIPVGSVTDGDCICPGLGGDAGTTFQAICMEDSSGTKYARIIAIDGNTGQYKIVGNYDFTFAGTYTPIGLSSPCPSDPVGVDVEVIELCDNNGKFLRHIIHGETGSVSGVYDTMLDGQTAYTIVGTVVDCSSGKDYESFDLCFKANTAGAGYAIGDIVRLNKWYDLSTGVAVLIAETAANVTQGGVTVTTPLTAANFDECPGGGLTYTETLVCNSGVTLIRRMASDGTLTFVGANGAVVAAPAIYSIGPCVSDYGYEILCDSTGTQFLRKYLRSLVGAPVFIDTTLDGATSYTPVGDVSQDCTRRLTSTVQRQVGVGAITIAVNAKSITFIALTGSPTVKIGAGTAVAIPSGVSLSWSGGDENELMNEIFVFTGTAATDFIVTTVR